MAMTSFVFPQFKWFLIMGIAELVLGVLLALGILRGRGTSSAVARFFGGGLLIVMGILFVQIRNTGEIVIDEGSMHLKVPFQRDKLVSKEDILSVLAVNFTVDTDYRPARKISGGNIGDVRTGWYRLANGTKAFVCVNGVEGLYIETSLGYPLLVGTPEFEEFEAAFAEYVYAPPAGEE